MKILIDMNLSPVWVLEFQNHGIEAVHWSTIGSLDAPDTDLMKWARQFDYIILYSPTTWILVPCSLLLVQKNLV